MSSAFGSQSNYIYQSNARSRTIVEAVIEVAREIATSETEIQSVGKFESWLKESHPGRDIEFEKLFQSTEEYKLWAQAFESLAWRVFMRSWGDQSNETWQVDFITVCHIVSRMLTALVWKEDRMWYPVKGDIDGIRPDPMRIRL